MTKQWFQIIGIWVLVAIAGTGAFLLFEVEFRFLVFSSIAAAAIALVSIEHLISSEAKDTVRQQVYVSAGTFALLAILTMLSLDELDF